MDTQNKSAFNNSYNECNKRNKKKVQTANSTVLELVTIAEACVMFKVSRQTIHNWINRGILDMAKVMRRTYFRKADLEFLINRQFI